MTVAQSACLGLMAEIQEICDDHHLGVYLIDKQLWAAVNGKGIVGYEADLAMYYDDFTVFRELVLEKMGNRREFESYEDNPKMPGLYYRYVDAGSTFFDLSDFKLFRKQGVYVNIHIIRRSGMAQNRLAIHEWAMGARLHRSRRARMYGKVAGALRKVLGEEGYRKHVLRLFEKAGKRKPGKTEIKRPLAKRMVFPAGFWDEQKRCRLSGYDFSAVSQPEMYLECQYGPNWRNVKVKGKRETYMCVCCPNLPYREYWKHVDRGMVDEKFFRDREKYMSIQKESIKDYNKQTREAWNVFYSIEEQFRIKDGIAEYKDDVLEAWERGQHDRAVMIMGDYAAMIEEYRKKKVALVADEDLWNLYIRWMLENGRDGNVEALMEMVKEGQLESA